MFRDTLSGFYVRAMYDDWARSYDKEFVGNQYSAPEVLCEQLSETLNIDRPHIKILDVGIGTGWLSKRFKERNPSCHITGVDISAGMLHQCKKNGLADVLVQRDFQKDGLPFEDGEFDVVVSSGVFELLRKPDVVIGEMGRVLKDGGGFSFTTYSDATLFYTCLKHAPEKIDAGLAKASLELNERIRFHALNYVLGSWNKVHYSLHTGVKAETLFVMPEYETNSLEP